MGTLTSTSTLSPLVNTISSRPRMLTIDILRGVALFGILYAHMIFWYAGGPLPEQIYQSYLDIPNGIVIAIYMIFFNAKFFSLFSFLFGLSFYIQIKSLAINYENPNLRFAWRLLLLGLIGIIHHIFWCADILTIYVPLGFLLLASRNLSNKTILVLAALLILNIPTKLVEAASIIIQGKPEFIPNNFIEEGKKYYVVMNSAPFTEVLTHNIEATKAKFEYQIRSGRLLITFGFFLLGMLAGKLGWFENTEKSKPFFREIWKKSGWTLLSIIPISGVVVITVNLLHININEAPWIRWLGGLLADVFNASLTLFYIAGICLLMLKPEWQARLTPLSYIGKMALSAYLMQSVFGVLIFFNVGFGLFLLTSPSMNIVLCCMFFVAQILLCRWWLNCFNHGPIEWMWRSATHLKWQAFGKIDNNNSR